MNARELVDSVSELVSLPAAHHRLHELLDDPRATREEIAEVVSLDPALTARLLRAVNSPPYANSGDVSRVADAAFIIDDADLKGLSMATTAVDFFGRIDGDMVDIYDFWNHSVCCGLVAKTLAGKCGFESTEDFFQAGLLHDIGHLPIYHAMPDKARQVLVEAGKEESYRYRAEREILGFTHAEVGAEILSHWGLPDLHREMVRYHHEPEAAVDYPIETALVHIATGVANRIEPSWKMSFLHQVSLGQIRPYAWRMTGLTPDLIASTLEEINMQSFAVLSVIDPDSMSIY
jgi:HD-like signal output (HDOD) protein